MIPAECKPRSEYSYGRTEEEIKPMVMELEETRCSDINSGADRHDRKSKEIDWRSSSSVAVWDSLALQWYLIIVGR
jgi:hypothetical protein